MPRRRAACRRPCAAARRIRWVWARARRVPMSRPSVHWSLRSPDARVDFRIRGPSERVGFAERCGDEGATDVIAEGGGGDLVGVGFRVVEGLVAERLGF